VSASVLTLGVPSGEQVLGGEPSKARNCASLRSKFTDRPPRGKSAGEMFGALSRPSLPRAAEDDAHLVFPAVVGENHVAPLRLAVQADLADAALDPVRVLDDDSVC
jgi:hypothetical protein